MPRIFFTPNLRRHVGEQNGTAPGDSVREVLDALFAGKPFVRSYVLDDQGSLRRHMNIMIDGAPIRDRITLADPVRSDSSIYILQALSGG